MINKYFTKNVQLNTGCTNYFVNQYDLTYNTISVELENIKSSMFGTKLFFITLGGSYMHGFESKQSDKDYRAVHLLPNERFLGIRNHDTVIERDSLNDIERNGFGLVSYEIGHYCGQLLKMNCNFLEQLFADSIVFVNPIYIREFFELQMYINSIISKDGLFSSYNGLMKHNYHKYIVNDNHVSSKKYLFLYKNGLSLQHTLRTGEVEPNINKVLEYGIDKDYTSTEMDLLRKLIERKREGVDDEILTIFRQDAESLVQKMFDLNSKCLRECKLQDQPTDFERCILEDWLISLRKKTI